MTKFELWSRAHEALVLGFDHVLFSNGKEKYCIPPRDIVESAFDSAVRRNFRFDGLGCGFEKEFVLLKELIRYLF